MTRILNKSDAEFYDYFATGVEGDVAFYVEEALSSGGQVLELGCGTGRISIPIADAGVSIVGLDNSSAMLKVARRKTAGISESARRGIRFLEGDMRTFKLNERFGLVIIPYRAFLHMMNGEDQRRALSRIHDHLVDRGRLIVNFYDPDLDVISANINPNGGIPRHITSYKKHDSGHTVTVQESRQYFPAEQKLEWYLLYEELDVGGQVISKASVPILQRYIHRYEMQYLLELCGFEIEELYGDFQRGPFRHGSEQVWVASKRCEV